MIMVAMSYFCRQNVSQISLEIVVNCSHPSEILALQVVELPPTLCTFVNFYMFCRLLIFFSKYFFPKNSFSNTMVSSILDPDH